jgi:hypothetical protein
MRRVGGLFCEDGFMVSVPTPIRFGLRQLIFSIQYVTVLKVTFRRFPMLEKEWDFYEGHHNKLVENIAMKNPLRKQRQFPLRGIKPHWE